MKCRGIVVVVAVVLVCLGLGMRIMWVNVNLPSIPVEWYGTGEWVNLDGAFQNSSAEMTQGYAVMVESAQIMSYDEYLQAYGGDVQDLGQHGNQKCVVDVGLRIRNDGGEEGGLNAFQMVLVPDRCNEYLICDIMNEDALWPKVQDGAGATVSLRAGTEYTAHIPYVFNGGEEVYNRGVEDERFSLLISRMPTRKMIKFDIINKQ